MKRGFSVHPVVLALFVLFLVSAMPWVLPLKGQAEALRGPASATSPAPLPPSRDEADPAIAARQQLKLEEWMRVQAGKIGEPDENPERTMSLLRSAAEKLSERELQDLESMALDEHQRGDQRFLAVEMLAMNPKIESARALGRILMSPEPSRSAEPALENILRARAAEGLGAHPRREAARILRESLYHVSDRSLLDRGERALLARKGSVPSPAEQDQKALRSILQRVR